MKLWLFVLVFFVPLSVTASAKITDPQEEKLLKHIDSRLMTEGLEFLKQTVNINSGTGNRDGVKAVAQLYETKLKALNFKTSWIDLESVKRAYHLVAQHPGNGKGPRILLMGHMDTVFEKNTDFKKCQTVSESKIKGPGIYDMKGGNLVILEALEALQVAGELEPLDITVFLTGDEEYPGEDPDGSHKTTRGRLIELAAQSDVILGFEPGTQGSQFATVSRRGDAVWKLKVTSKGGHSFKIFSKEGGPGAIYPLSRILSRFYDFRKEKYLTVNIGRVLGGSDISTEGPAGKVSGKLNIISLEAQAMGDTRFISEEQLKRTRKKMQEIVKEEVQRINKEYPEKSQVAAEITFEDVMPAMPPTPGNMKLLKLMSQVSKDLGYGEMSPLDPLLRGAGDVSFVAPKAHAILDGLGPLGDGAHSTEEVMDVNTLPIVAKRTAILLYRLAHQH